MASKTSPSKLRKSRERGRSRPGHRRYLSLSVVVESRPTGNGKDRQRDTKGRYAVRPRDTTDVIGVLRESIRRGDYRLPPGWRVKIHWSNDPEVSARAGKSDEWTSAMRESAKTTGWEQAVDGWLRSRQ